MGWWRNSRRAMLAAGILSAPIFANVGLAADVVLRLKDGDGFEIAGTLASFDGASYVVEARAFGRLKLEAKRYDCVGPGCNKTPAPTAPQVATLSLEPQHAAASNDFTIEGADAVSLSLLPGLVRGYAGSINASSAQLLGVDPRQMRFRLTSGKGLGVSMIDVRRSDSTSALDALINRRAAVALSSRAITDSEKASLERAAPRLREQPYEHVIGLDGLAIIVAPSNPAKILKIDDIGRIFTGQITNWSELGLPAGKINLYASSEKGGASERVAEIALNRSGIALPQGTKVLPDEVQLADAVARDPLGIAAASLSFIRSARGVDIANACGLLWRPTAFAVKSEEYPLSRRIYLYTAGEARPELAQGLVAFASSAAGQAAVRDSQLVDQSFEWTAFADELPRIEAWAGIPKPDTAVERELYRAVPEAMQGAQRLSTTFRFARNSSSLDAKARQDLQRLATFIRKPEMAGASLVLAGFTDITGSSQRRAVAGAG